MSELDIRRQAAELKALDIVDSNKQNQQSNPAAESASSADLCKELISATATILAPAWNIQDKEIDILGDAYGAVLDKWLPSLQGSWSPETTAIILTATMLAPRWHLPRKIENEPPKPRQGSEREQSADIEFAKPIEGSSSE